MFFRILVVCLVLAASYALYELWGVRTFYSTVHKTSAEFAVQNNDTGKITIVDFVHYECGACRMTSKILVEHAKADKTIKLIVRPVPFEGEGVERAVKMVLAAGLQGKFWEFHEAIISYGAATNDAFFKETANLYGLDYERLLKDAESTDILKMLEENANAAVITGIKSAPALMVGQRVFQTDGPLTLPDLLRMIQSEKT